MSTEDVTAEIAALLHGAGLTDKPVEFDGDMHSWRCGYPDQYGPCDCFESLVSDLADLIAARDRQVRAEALREAADTLDSRRSTKGIASRALDPGVAMAVAFLQDEADR